MPCAGKRGSDLISDDDALLARLLITTWSLATGRVLRADVPPSQLGQEELVAFWADGQMTAADPAPPRAGRRRAIKPTAGCRLPVGITGPGAGSASPLALAGGEGTRRVPLRPHRRAHEKTAAGRAARHSAEPGPARPYTPAAEGPVRGLFGIDIAGFTNPLRDEQVQRHLRDSMYRILERAFDGSGVPWQDCEHEDRGDGALIIVPTDVLDGLADPLPERLCGLVRVHNRLSSETARLQLRAAAHVGRVYRDEHGYYGDAVSYLFRLLNEPRLKDMLAASGNDVVFITSGHFYETVIRRHPTLVDPDAFRPLPVDVKHGTDTGWVRFPGTLDPAAGILPVTGSRVLGAAR